MACFSPLRGYRARRVNPSGKRSLVFNARDGFAELPQSVPCGQCVGCRLEYSRQWAMRCMHEASLHDDNCFLTLTYSDEYLPQYASLDKTAFPRFMKRLRKRCGKMRYFHAGEYGDLRARPHYHALLFGFDFSDKVPWSKRGDFPVWRSPLLEEVWPFGASEIGSCTFESAAYVARYVMKKVNGAAGEVEYAFVDEDGAVQRLQSEYTTMSRRPGIGKPWLDRYVQEVYPSDSVLVNGRLVKPPRFYDGQFELVRPDELELVKAARRRARCREDETVERLEDREKCAIARMSLAKRGLM